jgi:hypothetical protein
LLVYQQVRQQLKQNSPDYNRMRRNDANSHLPTAMYALSIVTVKWHKFHNQSPVIAPVGIAWNLAEWVWADTLATAVLFVTLVGQPPHISF